jgi:hypothetical protein
MTERESLRDVLFDHSDSRPCRLVWETLDDPTAAPDVDLADYVEVTRVTDGEVCLVASEDTADLYLRWNGSAGSYIYVACWPPWGVVDAGTGDRQRAEALLAERDDVRPVHFSETPFANGGPAADLSEWF